jgi:dienelactone hydrolase
MPQLESSHAVFRERLPTIMGLLAFVFVMSLLGACASDPEPEPPGPDTPTVMEDSASDTAPADEDVVPSGEDAFEPGDMASPEDVGEGLPGGPSSERHSLWPLGTKYASQGFWEYLPAAYGTGETWPLLVFFHGKGENGDGSEGDLAKLLKSGPPSYVSKNLWPLVESAAGDAFVVLSVQNSQDGCHRAEDIDAFIRWASKEYDVDTTRIYLTGLSCGARGVWNYLKSYLDDDVVAAVVPIAGNGEDTWEQRKCSLGAMPIWAFHGDADQVMNVNGTLVPMDGLAGCTDPAPVDAIKTIYEGVGHNSWTQTYSLTSGHDIYDWLLTHVNTDASR